MEDYIIEEVRNSALSILDECENNLNKYYEYMKKKESESKAEGWKISTLSKDPINIL